MDRVCPICGKNVSAGMTDEDNSFYCHEECFETYMDRRFSKHKWMALGGDATDELGGYYLISDEYSQSGYCGTGIYYTECEDDE